MSDKVVAVHTAFLSLAKRAEKVSTEILSDTFVDTEPLTAVLQTHNNQILYGRRGTGKTHALLYLAELVKAKDDHTMYIDLRSIGSDGSIYNDPTRSQSERSVRLVVDVLRAIGAELYGAAVEAISSCKNPEQLTTRLDDFDAAISEVRIVGEITQEERRKSTSSSSVKGDIEGVSSHEGKSVKVALGGARESGAEAEQSRSTSGREQFSINFGRLQSALRGLIEVIGISRLWILIDEWSEVPLELQPYLADLFRRTLLPVDHVVVKIAAIEHRSNFYLAKGRGEYIGLELGADISTDLNLDDFLVFDNNQQKSVNFFKKLLFRHIQSAAEAAGVASPEEMVQVAFTQLPAFDELVKAAEGVPRDAINLASKLAIKAWGRSVSMNDVRDAARDWYQQDKAASVQSNGNLYNALEHIISEVIGSRRARAFLLKSNTRHEVIDRLFDARLLHVLKKNISSRDAPGERYDAFKIDYGCYVELVNTQKATQGLFELEGGGYTDVPVDDYRSIRRAILNVDRLPQAS
ncbi:hypothetical protein ACQZ6F_12510 [Rhizobium sp. A22-96]